MKHILKANEDVLRHYGGFQVEAKKGETIEVDSDTYEFASRLPEFQDVKTVPENDADKDVLEKQESENAAKKEELMKLSKDELQKKASDLPGYSDSLNKSELADLILSPNPPSLEGEENSGGNQ